MDEILELAARLGKRISAEPRARRVVEARAALEDSLEDQRLLADHERQQGKIQMLEIDNKPIEPEDKRKLAELQAKVVGSEVLKNLAEAEADYVELMTLISQRIQQAALSASGQG